MIYFISKLACICFPSLQMLNLGNCEVRQPWDEIRIVHFLIAYHYGITSLPKNSKDDLMSPWLHYHYTAVQAAHTQPHVFLKHIRYKT